MYTNIVVGISNLIAIFMCGKVKIIEYKIIIYLSMVASLLYHIAESKYDKFIINPLNISIDNLLLFDRICVVIAFVVSIIKIIKYSCKINNKFIIIMFIGLVCLVKSEYNMIIDFEYIISNNDYLYYHTIWHICAFYCLTEILKT